MTTEDYMRSIDNRLANLEGALKERCEAREERISKLEKGLTYLAEKVGKMKNPAYALGGIVIAIEVAKFFVGR